MKMIKHVNVTAALAAAGLALTIGLPAGQALAGISTTKHNLSTTGPSTLKSDNDEICVFCHTPHDAIKNNNIVLWNHNLSTQSYTTYTSPTMDNAPGAMNGVTAGTATTSNLCLSCHDGTVALNAMNNPSNRHLVTIMSGSNQTNGILNGSLSTNLGTDLSNDHPVNMTYDRTKDAGLKDLTGVTTVKLYSNTVQCASCHDPHTNTNTPFLRASMSGSNLCLICHDK
jgi:predicted CXXCH cytochrome family protein